MLFLFSMSKKVSSILEANKAENSQTPERILAMMRES